MDLELDSINEYFSKYKCLIAYDFIGWFSVLSAIVIMLFHLVSICCKPQILKIPIRFQQVLITLMKNNIPEVQIFQLYFCF